MSTQTDLTSPIKTDDLIEALSQDLKPVSRSPAPTLMTAIWSVCALASAAFLLFMIFHVRDDLGSASSERMFWVRLILLGGSFFLGGWSVFWSGIPGRARGGSSLTPVLALNFFFYLSLVLQALQAPSPPDTLRTGMDPAGLHCTLACLGFAFLPGILLVAWLRKLAPTHPESSGRAIGLAMGALGAFAVSFECSYEQPIHILVWHGLPMLGLALMGSWVAPRLLRW